MKQQKNMKAKNTLVAPQGHTLPQPVADDWQCSVCQGRSYAVIGDLPSTEHGGTTADGREFHVIHRQRVQCVGCTQQAVVKRYE